METSFKVAPQSVLHVATHGGTMADTHDARVRRGGARYLVPARDRYSTVPVVKVNGSWELAGSEAGVCEYSIVGSFSSARYANSCVSSKVPPVTR